MDDEKLVRRITGEHEGPCGRGHVGELRFHAPTVVDHQPDAGGKLLLKEEIDLLRHATFEYLEVALGKAWNESPRPIEHCHLQNDEVGVNSNVGGGRPAGALGG